MKKSITRTILFILLVAASLVSYIYLNTFPTESSPLGDEETGLIEELEDSEPEILLPDIHLLKKVVESGKRFLPAS